MNLETNLKGRLRNTHLPLTNGLFPVFEAVVNSIQAIAESQQDKDHGTIVVTITRDSRPRLFDEPRKPGVWNVGPSNRG